MDDTTREFLSGNVLDGLRMVGRLLRANPNSLALNSLWVQIWIAIGSELDSSEALRGASSRVENEEWLAFMRMRALIVWGKRDEAARIGQELRHYPEIDGVVRQLEVVKGSLVAVEDLRAQGCRQAQLALAMFLAQRGALTNEPELFASVLQHAADDPFYGESAALWLFWAGARDEARAIVSSQEEANPPYPQPIYARAMFASGEGDIENTLVLCEKLLTACPYHCPAARLAKWANMKKRNFRKALSPGFFKMMKLVRRGVVPDPFGPKVST